MPGRFSPIPQPAAVEASSWQFGMLEALRENVELLTGFRGERDGASRAVLKSDIQVSQIRVPTLTRITAQGGGVPLSGVAVPTLQDYVELLRNVQQMADDMKRMQDTINTLITELRS